MYIQQHRQSGRSPFSIPPYNDLVTHAHRDSSYIPGVKIGDQRSLAQVFLKPGVAVGIIWRYDNERWENHLKNEYGVLLSLPSLKLLCKINLG
jgi:hypothetical protein